MAGFTEREKRLLLLLPDVFVPALITGNLFSRGVPICCALVFLYHYFLRIPTVSPHGPMRTVHMAALRFLYLMPVTTISLGHHYLFQTRYLMHTMLVMIGGVASSIYQDTYPIANMVLVQAFILRDPGDDLWIVLLPFSLALWAYHRYAIKL